MSNFRIVEFGRNSRQLQVMRSNGLGVVVKTKTGAAKAVILL